MAKMTFFKRARTSLVRTPSKTAVLLVLIFILGNLSSGAISIRHAVSNTETSLMSRLPAVASIQLDVEALINSVPDSVDWRSEMNPPTPEDFRAIGALPYVRGFDFISMFSFMSRDILPYGGDEGAQVHSGAEWITLTGVHNPYINDIESGLIKLTAGRTFEEGESHAMIVSEAFARTNNLALGDYFEIEYIQVNYHEAGAAFNWPTMLRENYFSSISLAVEVVGIFEIAGDLGVGSSFHDASAELQMLNRIYLPTELVEEFLDFQREQYLALLGNLSDLPEETFLEPLFLLEDPNDLVAFAAAANDLLPEFWYITDLSSNFAHLRSSMENMLWIADIVLSVTIGASVIILGLLTSLFLHDRKREIGIYLALGESKMKVFAQMLIEIISVSILAITLSIFTGNALSGQLSRHLMEQNLYEESHNQLMSGGGDLMPASLQMFDPGNMSIDEMLDAYDTSLGGKTIFYLFITGIGSVIISVLLPMGYVLKLNPKKVLL